MSFFQGIFCLVWKALLLVHFWLSPFLLLSVNMWNNSLLFSVVGWGMEFSMLPDKMPGFSCLSSVASSVVNCVDLVLFLTFYISVSLCKMKIMLVPSFNEIVSLKDLKYFLVHNKALKKKSDILVSLYSHSLPHSRISDILLIVFSILQKWYFPNSSFYVVLFSATYCLYSFALLVINKDIDVLCSN